MKDFFISYTKSDIKWARWIVRILENNGYTTIYQERDFKAGSNLTNNMHQAIIETQSTLAVLTPQYFISDYTNLEWTATLAQDISGKKQKLIPIRVEECELQGIQTPIVYIDIFNKTEEEAIKILLNSLGPSKNIERATDFPGGSNKNKIPFPGLVGKPTIPSGKQLTRRFIHTQISTEGLNDLENISNPYNNLYDPTDDQISVDISQAFCYLWLPVEQYFRVAQLQPLTPTAAICSIDPVYILNKINDFLDLNTIHKLKTAPSKLLPEYKEKSLNALSSIVLPNCLVASVTIPDIILGKGRIAPNYAYQVIVNLFLKPLVEMHRRIGMTSFHLHISKVNEKKPYLMGLIKSTLKNYFPKRGASSVAYCEENSSHELFSNLARLLAWVVGGYYNSANSKWISILEIDATKIKKGHDSSRLAES